MAIGKVIGLNVANKLHEKLILLIAP